VDLTVTSSRNRLARESTKIAAWRQSLSTWTRPLGYALLGFALFQWFGRTSSGPKAGSIARAFSLEAVDSPKQRVTLDDLRGNPAVIEVFASWCQACRSMAPTMSDLAGATRKRHVQFLGVALDTPLDEAKGIHRTWGIPFTIALADAQFSAEYSIKVLPTIIVLDAEGRVSHVTTGATRTSTIDAWLEDLGAARVR
jgi:cytochrome c biogenesis protein CcmG/thiol:disulfide interchange protein DsbE